MERSRDCLGERRLLPFIVLICWNHVQIYWVIPPGRLWLREEKCAEWHCSEQ